MGIYMNIPFIDLGKQYQTIKSRLKSDVNRVLDSQHYILGPFGRELEKTIAETTGAKFAFGVASGSDALYLALKALGIGPQDEVITTPFTFFATAGSISRTGAKPVFADIDPDTFNLDPKAIPAKITRRTKAIIPVHLFGLACDMGAIMKIAKAHSLFVVEDAAQSFGARYRGRQTGSIGDIGCFSFYPTKNLGGVGDGGMTVTSNVKLGEAVKLLREHGSRRKYHHDIVGINSRLDELQAAVLLVKLKYLAQWNKNRQILAGDYDKALKGLPLKTPKVPANSTHVYHLYTVRTPERDMLAEYLGANGIGNAVYYPLPLPLQPCYRSLGYRAGDFPFAEEAAREVLSLPMYPELPRRSVRRVSETIRKFFKTQ